VIARLEQFEPAQFDDGMRKRLLTEKFQAWLKQEIQTVSVSTITPKAQQPDQIQADQTQATPAQATPAQPDQKVTDQPLASLASS